MQNKEFILYSTRAGGERAMMIELMGILQGCPILFWDEDKYQKAYGKAVQGEYLITITVELAEHVGKSRK